MLFASDKSANALIRYYSQIFFFVFCSVALSEWLLLTDSFLLLLLGMWGLLKYCGVSANQS
jgi:hypothetical protein